MKVQQPIFGCYKSLCPLSSLDFPAIPIVCESLLCSQAPQSRAWHIPGSPSTAGIKAGKRYPLSSFRKPWHQQNSSLHQRDRPFFTGTWVAEPRLGMVPPGCGAHSSANCWDCMTQCSASPALALCKLQRDFPTSLFFVLFQA